VTLDDQVYQTKVEENGTLEPIYEEKIPLNVKQFD
jgi:hypothetical protein